MSLMTYRELAAELETLDEDDRAYRFRQSASQTGRALRDASTRSLPTCAGVYFVQAAVVNLIKIGMATNIRSRVRSIAGDSPVKLALLGYVDGARDREAELHVRFQAHRHHGEWFRPADELLDFIVKEATFP